MAPTSIGRTLTAIAVAVSAVVAVAGCVPLPGRSPSGVTCWEKRAYYQARNRGLKETLGSGTAYSTPCVLAAYTAIEQAAAEFGVTQHIDAMVRIAACESLLQPDTVGIADPTDVGLFQWNEKPPRYWWGTIRRLFNTWQDTKAAAAGDHYVARHASPDRTDPYNAARVAAWVIATHPRSWPVVWHCRGTYDHHRGRIR